MKNMLLAAAAVTAMTIATVPAVRAADAPKPATAAKPATALAVKPAAATPAKPTPAQVANMQRAARVLRGFNALLEAKETNQAVKVAIVACLYNNKLATIAAAAGQVMAKDPSLKEDNISDVLHAAGGVCGLSFNKKAATGTAPAPLKPAASGSTTGR